MFKKLQQKWGVGPVRLLLILCTFAIGGSLCGRIGAYLLGLLAIDSLWVRVPLYIVLITLLWPLCVLIISIPLGQWTFFTRYLRKLWMRIGRRAKS